MSRAASVRLAASNTAAAPAWAAYDAAMIELQRMYLEPARNGDTPALRQVRLTKAQEVASLWERWRQLYLNGGGGR